jgi:hypothetical protein
LAAEHHANVQQAGVVFRDYVLAGDVIKVNDDLERAQTLEIAGKHGAPIYASANLLRDRVILRNKSVGRNFHSMRLHSSSTETCSSVESLRSLRVQLGGIALGATAMELDENGNVLRLPAYRNRTYHDEWRLQIQLLNPYNPQTQTGIITLVMSEGRCELQASMVSISQTDFDALLPSANTAIDNRNLNGLSRYFENGGTLTFTRIHVMKLAGDDE